MNYNEGMPRSGSGQRRYSSSRKQNRKAEKLLLFIMIMALIPTILCIVLFVKQNKLTKQVEELEQAITKKITGEAPKPTPDISEGLLGDTGNSEMTTPEPMNTTPEPSSDITSAPEPTKEVAINASPTPLPTPTTAVDPATGEALSWSDKTVYLTFDDGPSDNTGELLDLLNEYGVKVTFFVIGKNNDKSKAMYKRIVDEGHSIAMHSYSHEYDELYGSVEDFEKDFAKISNLLYDSIGFVPNLYRFPGGSSNSKCKKLTIQPFIKVVMDHNARYFDWNVENGDATGVSYSVEELAENVIKGVSERKVSVVLMHDTNAKRKTLESMKIVIPTLLERGVRILPITDSTDMVVHVKPATD